jgi:hypothetical protein
VILESLPGKAKPFRNVLRPSRTALEMDSGRACNISRGRSPTVREGEQPYLRLCRRTLR